jgi:hypothetical protein
VFRQRNSLQVMRPLSIGTRPAWQTWYRVCCCCLGREMLADGKMPPQSADGLGGGESFHPCTSRLVRDSAAECPSQSRSRRVVGGQVVEALSLRVSLRRRIRSCRGGVHLRVRTQQLTAVRPRVAQRVAGTDGVFRCRCVPPPCRRSRTRTFAAMGELSRVARVVVGLRQSIAHDARARRHSCAQISR